MAKQAVGPVVRHLEKGVLAAAAAIFLFVVATYGVVSPNKVALESDEPVGPTGVDSKLRDAAERLVQRLQTAKPKEQEVQDPLPDIQLAGDPLELAKVPPELPRAVMYAPVPPELKGGDQIDRRPLIQVAATEKPQVGPSGRSGAYLPPPEPFTSSSTSGGQTEASLRDINWVTIHALFNREEQERRAQEAGWDPSSWKALFLGLEVQRREQRPDGSFTDWQAIDPVTRRLPPQYPAPKVIDGAVRPEDRQEVVAFKDLISKDENQLALMRPLFPQTAYGDQWEYPKLGSNDVLVMDCDYQQPDCKCRYPECSGAADTSQLDVAGLLDDAKNAIADCKLDKAKGLLDKARDLITKDAYNQPGKVSRQQRELDDLGKDLEKARATCAEQKPAGRSPVQVLWAHDDTLEGGRTYQYRVRPRIFNQYCGKPALLENAKDAEQVELDGPWSEPSDLVTVPEDTHFFVKSSRAERREVTVQVFKWYRGQWLDDSFSVSVGEPVGKESRVKVPPNGDRIPVLFETGARIVDIDFRRPYRTRSRRGNKLGPMGQTTALVYVDASGRLHERLEAVDDGSEAYRDMKSRVWKP